MATVTQPTEPFDTYEAALIAAATLAVFFNREFDIWEEGQHNGPRLRKPKFSVEDPEGETLFDDYRKFRREVHPVQANGLLLGLNYDDKQGVQNRSRSKRNSPSVRVSPRKNI